VFLVLSGALVIAGLSLLRW